MKICLLSASTKHIEWEDYGHPDWFDITRPNHQAYADKWGWDYISLMIGNQAITDRHPTWLKIRELRRAVDISLRENKWDWIVWIDADACIVNENLDFTQFFNVPEGKPWDIILPKMQPDPEHGKCWTKLSTGIMAVRCTTYTQLLLKRMWEEPGDFRYGGFHEQSWLDEHFRGDMTRCDNLNYSELEDIHAPMPLGKLLAIPYKWHLTTTDNEIPFVYHAGGSTPTKTERLKQVLCI